MTKIMKVNYNEKYSKYAVDEHGDLIGLNLDTTHLGDTQWGEIVALLERESVQLQALNLSDNQLSELKLPAGIKALKKLDVSGNTLANLPAVVVKGGNQSILEYLQQVDDQGGETAPLYEAKLLIVGQPGAGKTTLLKKLKDPSYLVAMDGDKDVKSGLEMLSIEVSGKQEKRIGLLDHIIKEVERIHKLDAEGFDFVRCRNNGLKKVPIKSILAGVSEKYKDGGIPEIKKWIKTNRMDIAIDKMQTLFAGNNNLILLIAQWNTLQSAIKRGTISRSEENAETASITSGFLKTLDETV